MVNLLPEEHLLPSLAVSVQSAEKKNPRKLVYKLQSRDSTGELITQNKYSQLNTSSNSEESDIHD